MQASTLRSCMPVQDQMTSEQLDHIDNITWRPAPRALGRQSDHQTRQFCDDGPCDQHSLPTRSQCTRRKRRAPSRSSIRCRRARPGITCRGIWRSISNSSVRHMKKHINSPQGYPGGCNGPAAVLRYTRTEATWRCAVSQSAADLEPATCHTP